MIRNIGFVGDIHCGSHWGLWPVESLPENKNRFKGVRYLNECFTHLVNNWPELDLLVLTGDLIDGKQRKSTGCGIFTSKLCEQVEGAIEILRPLIKKSKRVVRVYGTPYHEDFDDILSALDKEFDIKTKDQVLNIKLNDGILNVAHHPASGSALYHGTAVDKESLWSTVAAAERNVPNARWIVRAHKHNYMVQETRFKSVCICPCFELPTPHAVKVNYWRFQPSIGGVLMSKDNQHPFGYRFIPQLYDVPQPRVLSVDSL
jgi:hypothetical protein